MVRKVIRTTILNHEVLKVPFGQTLGKLDQFKKKLELARGSRVESATLDVVASQTFLSGADLSLSMNSKQLRPILEWHALENNRKSHSYDVTTEFLSGVNVFSAVYRTAFGVLSDQELDLSAVLVLNLVVPEASSPGVEIGKTDKTSESVGTKVVQGAKDAAALIAGLAVVGVIAWAGYGVYRGTLPGKLGKKLGF